jgi:hypothetical protein
VHRHNARLPGSGQSAVGGTGAGLSDHRATCVTAESWCGRAAGIDGPTWVMATYKIADCTRYIPYPIMQPGGISSCSNPHQGPQLLAEELLPHGLSLGWIACGRSLLQAKHACFAAQLCICMQLPAVLGDITSSFPS